MFIWCFLPEGYTIYRAQTFAFFDLMVYLSVKHTGGLLGRNE